MQKFWKAIGLPRSKDMPAALGWVEILTGFYACYGFLVGVIPVVTEVEGITALTATIYLSIAVIALMLPVLAVLLTTRRGGRIAYWIAIAMLLRPITMTLQKVITAPENAAALISVPNALILASTFTAAILLLLPSSREWVRARRVELRR